jgi:phospholipid transport system substrate-binding protein
MASTRPKTTGSRWIRRSATGLFAAALLAAPAFADAEAEARAVVQQTVNQVLAILGSKGLSEDQRRQQIEEIAYAHFDFATISRLVLARNWKRFSPEQQQEFIEQFKLQLSKTYGGRITRYQQEEVKVDSQRLEANGDVTVATHIEGGEAKGIEVDYRLREKDGAWKVIDVIIEGVSLVSSYRAQFAEILGHEQPEALLKQLREKNTASPA